MTDTTTTTGSAPAEGAKPEAQADRPPFLQDKFATIADQAKAYGELEKHLGATRPQLKIDIAGEKSEGSPDVKPEAKPTADASAPEMNQKAAAIVADAGLDMNALHGEFMQHGDLTPESYAALGKRGIPREAVTRYISAVRAEATMLHQDLAASVGGESELEAVLTWGRHGLDDSSKEAWNAACASNNPATVKLALRAIRAAYIEANGRPPERVLHGTKAGPGPSDVYADRDELQRDIQSPRYKTDQKFRDEVAMKLHRSGI